MSQSVSVPLQNLERETRVRLVTLDQDSEYVFILNDYSGTCIIPLILAFSHQGEGIS
jgi:hypothetical protein